MDEQCAFSRLDCSLDEERVLLFMVISSCLSDALVFLLLRLCISF